MPEEKTLPHLLQLIAQKNDQQAYKELYYLLFEPLFHFSLSIVKSQEVAEEIVSDVFLKAWQHREKLANLENPRLYLYVITKNLSLNYRKQKAKDIITYFDHIYIELPGLDTNPEQLFITSEMSRRIQSAVNELPPRCKIIFKLVKEDGLKHKEVAELLELSVKTVEAQIAIALKKLTSAISLDTAVTHSSNKS